jgi:hypothetical protein
MNAGAWPSTLDKAGSVEGTIFDDRQTIGLQLNDNYRTRPGVAF